MKKRKRQAKKKKCTDHLGNRYKSIGEMCRKYGIDRVKYWYRIHNGWSKKDALTKHVKDSETKEIKCTDHLGNGYGSIREMCAAYGIDRSVYESRIRIGWDLKRALTEEKHVHGFTKKACTDHLGKRYDSIKDMCNAYNIKVVTFNTRIKNGWSLSDALTKEVGERGCNRKKCKDHLGNTYSSISRMCLAYGIDTALYRTRLRQGWQLEDVLTK